MAREEADREDLLAEATALVERIELTIAGRAAPIVAGFRRDGSLSLYFGSDPVFQFNARGELRRAFVDGLLFKAVHGRLASLRRERTTDATNLVRHDLSEEEESRLVERLQSLLRDLDDAFEQGRVNVTGQVPSDVDVIGRVQKWLQDRGETISIARSPRVG